MEKTKTFFQQVEGIEGAENRWNYYTIYEMACCECQNDCGGGSGHTETAFAKGNNKTDHCVFTKDNKSNPENLCQLNLTKNRWGWAINIKSPGTYEYPIYAGAGLNYISKGTLVGKLTVEWNGNNAKFNYDMLGGYLLSGLHIFAGDDKPTTIAPGQYGYTESFNPKVSNAAAQIAVSDVSPGGIWIIAHAGVFFE